MQTVTKIAIVAILILNEVDLTKKIVTREKEKTLNTEKRLNSSRYNRLIYVH